LLDAGPYRLEGGGITSWFILPLGLMDGGGWKSQRYSARRGVVGDERARVRDEIGMAATTITIFVILRTQHPFPQNDTHLRLAHPRKRRSRAGLGQLLVLGMPTFGDKEGLGDRKGTSIGARLNKDYLNTALIAV
jgi:hypothetical protein